jgi:uncharacterized protein
VSTAYTLLQAAAPMLRNLSAILDKAEAHATASGTSPDIYVDARLAPDMFNLARQVQFACYGPVAGAERLTGRLAQPPGEPDTDFAALKTRIASAIGVLDALNASDFDGADDRDIVQPMQGTRVLEMKGAAYVRDWLMPNFYFHLVTAYDILRNQGVEVSKRDYLAHNAHLIRDTAA